MSRSFRVSPLTASTRAVIQTRDARWPRTCLTLGMEAGRAVAAAATWGPAAAAGTAPLLLLALGRDCWLPTTSHPPEQTSQTS